MKTRDDFDYVAVELAASEHRTIIFRPWPFTKECICYSNGSSKDLSDSSATISPVFVFESPDPHDWMAEIAKYLDALEADGKIEWSDPLPHGGFIAKFA